MIGNEASRGFLSKTVQSSTNVICVLLAMNILSNNFGILDLLFLRLLTVFLLLGVTLLNLPLTTMAQTLKRKNQALLQLLLGSILLISAYLILLFTATQELWLASVPLLLAGITIIRNSIRRTRQDLHLLTISSFGYALFYVLVQTVPFLWYGFQQFSLLTSQAIGLLTGTPLLLGPSTGGLWIIAITLIFLGSSYIVSPRHTKKETIRFIGSIGGVFLIWLIYLAILSVVSFPTKTDTVMYHPYLFIACLIPTFFYLSRYNYKEPTGAFPLQKYTAKKILRNGTLWTVLFIFLSATLLTAAIPTVHPSSEHKKIMFYAQHMLGTWDIPQYGKYGRDAVGMFGLLPVYFTSSGYDSELIVDNTTAFLNATQPIEENITRSLNLTDYVSIIETDRITSSLLQDVSVFVVTNLNTSFTADEQTVIWEFVKHGGSLLVLGDHTNVGGIQTSLNELLAPVGISFRFDAALPLDDKFKWATCYELPSSEITTGLTSLDQLQISVGASLNITVTSFPVVVGKYALSDTGNHSAADMAYLGDYTYNKGEQLGDLILVAGSYYGEGKILVFGDTSSFQNSALPLSYPFIQRAITWLLSTKTTTIQILQIGFSLFLIGGAILALVLLKRTNLTFAVLPVALCVALLCTTAINPILVPDQTLTRNLALIDTSHGERFSTEPFTDTSVSGLIVNLQRNNFLPLLQRGFSTEQISKSKLLFIIAPTQAFTPGEVTVLKQYMEDGGFIILATGYEEEEASLPLLKELNLDVTQIPLGPVPYVEGNTTAYQNEPRFVDAWPILYEKTQGTSYYNFTWGDTIYDLVVLIKQGRGGLVLISDSQFLLDKNIESIYDYWPGNILFLKYLLDALTSQEAAP